MCSISGIITIQVSLEKKEYLINEMMNTLWHRGPDSKGTYIDPNIAIGSTRLKIIGLKNGDQPIYSECKNIILVCNGEVLNYMELKKQLIDLGHIFRTDTDVEVLIHLYEQYSDRFLENVNGQFALALYDKKRRTIILARDRAGISPLFYYYNNNNFYFASEIKALFQLDLEKLHFNRFMTPYVYGVFLIPTLHLKIYTKLYQGN